MEVLIQDIAVAARAQQVVDGRDKNLAALRIEHLGSGNCILALISLLLLVNASEPVDSVLVVQVVVAS